MGIKDITIFQGDYPRFQLVPEDLPSQLTLCFLASLTHSPHFKKELNYFREEYNIPKEGVSVDELLKSHKPSLYRNIIDELKSFIFYYDLPNSFLDRFYLLVVFNAFIDIPEEEYPSLCFLINSDIQNAIENIEENMENVGAIVIDHKISKEQLHLWIDKNWSNIEKDMQKYLPSFPLDGNKFTNIEIADEILCLSEEKKTISEISDYLINRYPDNPYVADVGWIKNKLTRYKQWIDKIAQKYASMEHNQPE